MAVGKVTSVAVSEARSVGVTCATGAIELIHPLLNIALVSDPGGLFSSTAREIIQVRETNSSNIHTVDPRDSRFLEPRP